MTRILRSPQMAAAVAVLVAFNLAAFAWFADAGGVMRPVPFTMWSLGDLIVGLVALTLTESR